MWYKNIAGMFFRLLTKHACDKQTDGRTGRITTPKTAIAWLRRAVKPFLLPTKLEVSISTHYEDMNNDTKCRKWGGLW